MKWHLEWLRIPLPGIKRGKRPASRAAARHVATRTTIAKRLPWLLGTAAFLLILHALLFPVAPRIDVDFPDVGEIATRDIHAPISFSAPYLEQDVEMLRLQRVLVVPPVVQRLATPRENALHRVSAWRAAFSSHAAMHDVDLADRVGLLSLRFPEIGSEDIGRALTTVQPDTFFAAVGEALDMLFTGGVVDFLPPGNYRNVSVVTGAADVTVDVTLLTLQGDLESRLAEALAAQGVSERDRTWGARLVRPLVAPNLVYLDEETRRRRVEARRDVPAFREFLQGERMIERGVRVTEQDALYLESLLDDLVAQGDVGQGGGTFWHQMARSIMAAFLLALFGWVALLYFGDLLLENRKLLSGVAAFALFLVVASFCLRHPSLGPYAVPIPLLSVLVTVLFRDRVGYTFTVLAISWMMFFTGIRPSWLLIWLMVGVVSVTLMRRIRHRDQFYRAIAILAALQIAMISLLRLDGGGTAGLMQDYLVGVITPVASVAIALFLLPIVEPLVGACSDLTLLELSDLNHPLLKKMSLESQGTFHHSQVVGQLAESAAQSIGANSLLTRVGALFHDIGKTKKTEYFVENQGGGPNKHDELSPSMSALVVASHVKDGIELARKWRLPEGVIDFIPEHHGTHVMKFFYHKALESAGNETVKVDDFRYPGPKPRSRETAILMLADAVEAATRSLAKPTPGRIREIVKQVIDERMFSGELDECGLTLKDLATIRDSFLPLLAGIHHQRIAYPGQRERDRDRGAAAEADVKEPA
jgi:cyclic-di-AMP phosphodiesterase PgpH